MATDEARLRTKLTLRLVAPIMLLFVLNSLDRGNTAFAALQMNADLGLSHEAFGFGISIFFFGYILLQAPHAFSARILGPRVWIAITMFVWGLIATAMAFIETATHFYVLRFLLGVAEGGFAPGIVYYLSTWVPRRFRGWALAWTMVAIPISVIIGGPLSGWLMSVENPLGWSGWRWMFLIEGLPPVLLAPFALMIFTNKPQDAKWLTADEKAVIAESLEEERLIAESRGAAKLSQVIRAPALWMSMAVWFCILGGNYGIMFWLPQVVKQMSGGSDLQVGVISAIPWIFIGSGMLLNSWWSDKTQQRFKHFAVPAVLAAVFMCLTMFVPMGVWAMVCLVIGGFLLGCAQGSFWPIPTTFMSGAAAAVGITVINICGNSAGLVVPAAFGWLRAETGSFRLPVFLIAGMLLFAAALMIPLKRYSLAFAARDDRARPASTK